MALINFLDNLQTKHEKLEKEIKKSYNSHSPDQNIKALKKMKLSIKDKITKISETV